MVPALVILGLMGGCGGGGSERGISAEFDADLVAFAPRAVANVCPSVRKADDVELTGEPGAVEKIGDQRQQAAYYLDRRHADAEPAKVLFERTSRKDQWLVVWSCPGDEPPSGGWQRQTPDSPVTE